MSGKVLIVDDDASMCETLATAMSRRGFAVQHRALRDEVKRLRRQVHASRGGDEIVGVSPATRKVADMVDRLSETDATVLITGESGTGKELVARALHQHSRRAAGPFVAIN